jgi:NAD(P)-dependent dehydrogenase (short-subunit alcohol dehydrogenase family)
MLNRTINQAALEPALPFSGDKIMRKVALITGATRGIGKACALSLARQGYDIVATGRTVREGEGTVNVPFVGDDRKVAVPGSLEQTVTEVEALGREALGLRMDLLDRATMEDVVADTMERWGRIDVLVNNALYGGRGLMFPFDQFSIEQLETAAIANLVNQAYMTRLVLPVMLRQKKGAIIGLSSVAGIMASPRPAREGGWGFVYGGPKSGFHRISEFVHQKDGIFACNVEPGFTVTEATIAMFGPGIVDTIGAEPTEPKVTGDVVAWLVTQPEARELAGKLISTPKFFEERGIIWPS